MDVGLHPELPGARLEVPAGAQRMIQCKVLLSHTYTPFKTQLLFQHIVFCHPFLSLSGDS